MKRFLAVLLILTLPFGLAACSNKAEQNESEVPQNNESTETESEDTTMNNNKENKAGGILVVYFSATGTTKTIAEYAADILNADIYEITAADPYTEDDLAYYTDGRADREQNDSSARPAISDSVENMEQYDTILLGYPIWHGQAPRIVSTFLESYDFSGKTILPFCTSHSSEIGTSDTNLHALTKNANWLSGRRFASEASREDIKVWLDEMNITPIAVSTKVRVFDFETHTVMLNSGYEMPINGLGTYSLHDDECRNSVRSALENGVRLIDAASAYGNEEEIGQAILLFQKLPRHTAYLLHK